ncbi:MAG: hypothetical protein GW903_09865 [Alphaproteobacteria bacterium]|nr:hypothetical protein [Alphaproteobacteria bacterium]NCQ89245.1 hypothetical protein [Alphaproteobacteria bacterium]NCT08384.1 hypothetical protein [Alphaproteobacteria bacterium]
MTSSSRFQLYCFITLCGAYGLIGSPTPDAPDWKELLIAIALLGSIGISGIAFVMGLSQQKGIEVKKARFMRLFLYYGISVPLVVAVFRGGEPALITRDVIGFLFLLLPLFLFPLIHSNKRVKDAAFYKICLYSALFIGMCFAVRVIWPALSNTTELLYLANFPLVILTAIYCMGQVLALGGLRFSLRQAAPLMGYVLLTALVVIAMLQDVQRAPMAALGLSLIVLILDQFIKAPKKAIVSVFILTSSIIFLWPYWHEVLLAITYKTSIVGLNMRAQELAAVWQVLSQSPTHFLFGAGWGGQFESPAVGNLSVTFTHSLLSYMALKTGFFGIVLTLIYMGVISYHGAGVFFRDRVVGIALLWAFIIPIFLYASYKSLDFGLLLTLILALSLYNEKQRPLEVTQ